ncbi:MAG TPA: electron transport complex subunit RsxA [Lentisphaeria bacterium]|nr:electron transport complex subunit RsxA [Lentisphaeria bacterium]HCG49832.1 electron transport complex subunit RsxA [Lentisphaeria bacterium]
MPSNEWLLITVGAVLVNNIVLSRILGICPFLGVSKKIKTALGMAGAVIFVMGIASFATSALYHLMLSAKISVRIGSFQIQNLDIAFTKILIFIVVIAGLVQIVEILLQKFSPALYSALGIYLPLITTNCAVLGAAELNAASGRGILASTVYGICSGIGFGLALILFASIRERLELSRIPKMFQGTAIALITAGILALAFMGFSGLVK